MSGFTEEEWSQLAALAEAAHMRVAVVAYCRHHAEQFRVNRIEVAQTEPVLNALGHNGDLQWQPFYSDANGVQRDLRGVRIFPFKYVQVLDAEAVKAFMDRHGMVQISLDRVLFPGANGN